ncbi:MAG: HAD family hydrolase [Rhodospirillales bacterium]|nr:HAD family hydrolase [Rhodospirillales bacterium]
MTDISIDAFFFDFDGVLADSTPIKIKAFMSLYAEHGPDVREKVRKYALGGEGISRVEKIREAHLKFLGIDLGDDELNVIERRYSSLVVDAVVECDWVPGAREFLDAHVGKTPLFVISGTPQDEMRRIVERRGMADYFVSVRGSPPRKPPIFRQLLDDHALAPERTLYVGDAIFDYHSAKEVGLPFVGRVPHGAQGPFPAGTRTICDLTELSEFI